MAEFVDASATVVQEGIRIQTIVHITQKPSCGDWLFYRLAIILTVEDTKDDRGSEVSTVPVVFHYSIFISVMVKVKVKVPSGHAKPTVMKIISSSVDDATVHVWDMCAYWLE